MVTRKAFIIKDQDIVLPYTRGELVTDSKGEEAFRSQEFVASDTKPGLLDPKEKKKIRQAVFIPEEIPENKIVQVQQIDKDNNIINVYPKTKAEAVIVTRGEATITLNEALEMDDYPTQNSTRGVTSGGVWQHIDDTVGEIHRNVIKI